MAQEHLEEGIQHFIYIRNNKTAFVPDGVKKSKDMNTHSPYSAGMFWKQERQIRHWINFFMDRGSVIRNESNNRLRQL